MQFRLPKALADSCLIPELSCQFKPFPWQGFNSFHLSWELEKVRERTLPWCTHRLDCLTRKASLLEALAGNSGMERVRYPNRAAQLLLTAHTTSGSQNPHRGSASARHPRDPVEPPQLTGPRIIRSVSDRIQCTSLCDAACSGFHPAGITEMLSLMGQKEFCSWILWYFGLSVSAPSKRGLLPPEWWEKNRRDTWFPAAFMHLHLPQCAQIPHTFPSSDVLQSRTITMQQNHTQVEQKKTPCLLHVMLICAFTKSRPYYYSFFYIKMEPWEWQNSKWDETQEPSAQQKGLWQASHRGLLSSPTDLWMPSSVFCPALHRDRDHVGQ